MMWKRIGTKHFDPFVQIAEKQDKFTNFFKNVSKAFIQTHDHLLTIWRQFQTMKVCRFHHASVPFLNEAERSFSQPF